MSAPAQRRAEPGWRRHFRRLRITVLLAVFAVVGVLLYLNLVGLPEFARRPLLERLRERGLDLQVANLRWHYFRGIVAEQVKFGRTDDTEGPRFTATEAELNLNYLALLERRIEISGVGLREGRVSVPVEGTNQLARKLSIGNIRADLRLLPDDVWWLEDFQAQFSGAEFFLNGAITNASAVREWAVFRAGAPGAGDPQKGRTARQRLSQLAETLEKVRFQHAPEIRGMLSGDARDLETFTLRLTITAPDADTPWGKFADGVLTVRLRPAAPVERPQAELQLQASNVKTPWAEVFHPQLELRIIGAEAGTNRVNATLEARAAAVNTRWASVTNTQVRATWEHALTNALPLAGTANVQAESAVTRWIGARDLTLTASLKSLAHPPPVDAALGPWEQVWPYALGWSLRGFRCDTEKLDAEEIAIAGQWTAPSLTITNLFVRFPSGRLEARAQVAADTREAAFELTSDFDPHTAKPLLTEKAVRWLNKYGWQNPPHIAGRGAVVLPDWTNRQPDWRGEVLPTLRLAAFLTATNAAYLQVPVDWVRTHVTFTNQVWHLPDLVAGRAEGTLELEHIADDRTREYWFGLRSTISPEALRPVLGTNAQRGLDYFRLTSSPVVEGGVWGRWRDHASVGFTGRVTLADFSFREQDFDQVTAELRYTNRVLEFFHPRVERGSQLAYGDGITADFGAQRIYFTNMVGNIEPLVITRCIGPKTTASLEPYVFREPPHARVNGFAPLKGNDDADLTFDLEGGPFEWQVFRIPHVAGRVHWLNGGLGLSNIQMRAYGGTGAGQASFDLGAGAGTPYQFELGLTNVDLKLLLADIAPRTNRLEGRLDGWLVVTKANATSLFTWNGHGHAGLSDGWIWSLPIFGVLSKPLDSIVPGLGSTRFSQGTADFAITNGVVYSSNLEMRGATTRLQYMGRTDFAGNVDARVRAEPMRDAAVIGPVLNLALWPVTKLMEYKITGTLGEPKPEPLHIPGLLYKPLLHPFRLIENLFTPDASGTNGPPKQSAPPPP